MAIEFWKSVSVEIDPDVKWAAQCLEKHTSASVFCALKDVKMHRSALRSTVHIWKICFEWKQPVLKIVQSKECRTQISDGQVSVWQGFWFPTSVNEDFGAWLQHLEWPSLGRSIAVPLTNRLLRTSRGMDEDLLPCLVVSVGMNLWTLSCSAGSNIFGASEHEGVAMKSLGTVRGHK